MQFRHPEILYALFFLLIPIIVHLFQLRRFNKVAFTNVQFLKQVELQTRKSSRLKKFLVLISRLLLFTALVFAFSQPFLSKTTSNLAVKNYVYLDNSYSLQAKGKDGELFNRAIQDIIANSSDLDNISLFTNDQEFLNLASKDIKNTLLSLKYHSGPANFSATLLKLKSQLSNENNLNNILLISDFQNINMDSGLELDSINSYYITQLKPLSLANISVDSIYISNQTNETINLTALIKNFGNNEQQISVSLYNDQLLSGKSAVKIEPNSTAQVVFSVANSESIKGKIEIDDPNLTFDNSLYFTVQKPDKIKVAALGEDTAFLNKIYSENEFILTESTLRSFDYNLLDQLQLLILNELEDMPDRFIGAIKDFVDKGGSLVIIPVKEANISNYNKLLNAMRIGSISNIINNPLSITKIHFSHPLMTGVFEKKISNFQYPTVKSVYSGTFNNASSILSFENQKDFISQYNLGLGTVYWLSSPINSEQSTFKDSPLIVPIFYNFGLYSFKASQLYYTIGNNPEIEIAASIKNDEVLHLQNNTEDFIPLQKITSNKVSLSLIDKPNESGFLNIIYKDQNLGQLAFNYNRNESDLQAYNLKDQLAKASNITYSDSVNNTFIKLSDSLKSTELWKWFIAMALLFLIIELTLLKSKLK